MLLGPIISYNMAQTSRIEPQPHGRHVKALEYIVRHLRAIYCALKKLSSIHRLCLLLEMAEPKLYTDISRSLGSFFRPSLKNLAYSRRTREKFGTKARGQRHSLFCSTPQKSRSAIFNLHISWPYRRTACFCSQLMSGPAHRICICIEVLFLSALSILTSLASISIRFTSAYHISSHA